MPQELSPGLIRQMYTVIRRVLREERNSLDKPTRRVRESYAEGYADGAIAAGTGAAPADGYVLVWADDDNGNWVQQKYADGSNVRVAVKSKWDTSISDNTYCHIKRVGRYWQIVAASCSAEA